jgi:hypothetical protein
MFEEDTDCSTLSATIPLPPLHEDAPYEPLQSMARRVFDTVREQFRDGDKSSNKARFATHEDDLRAFTDLSRSQRAARTHFDLLVRQAPLAERCLAKVGNCTEMAFLAVEAARYLGLRANVWGFMAAGRSFSHEFAIVESRGGDGHGLSSAYSQGIARENFDGCDDFYVVDPWAGICCAGSDYDTAFMEKMAKWASQGKRIWRAGEWLQATDPAWLAVTVESPRRLLLNSAIPDYAVRV